MLVSDWSYPVTLLGLLINYLTPHGPPSELQSNKKTEIFTNFSHFFHHHLVFLNIIFAR